MRLSTITLSFIVPVFFVNIGLCDGFDPCYRYDGFQLCETPDYCVDTEGDFVFDGYDTVENPVGVFKKFPKYKYECPSTARGAINVGTPPDGRCNDVQAEHGEVTGFESHEDEWFNCHRETGCDEFASASNIEADDEGTEILVEQWNEVEEKFEWVGTGDFVIPKISHCKGDSGHPLGWASVLYSMCIGDEGDCLTDE